MAISMNRGKATITACARRGKKAKLRFKVGK